MFSNLIGAHKLSLPLTGQERVNFQRVAAP
jgi:hypothetical protein